jgi:hypothetical protein
MIYVLLAIIALALLVIGNVLPLGIALWIGGAIIVAWLLIVAALWGFAIWVASKL